MLRLDRLSDEDKRSIATQLRLHINSRLEDKCLKRIPETQRGIAAGGTLVTAGESLARENSRKIRISSFTDALPPCMPAQTPHPETLVTIAFHLRPEPTNPPRVLNRGIFMTAPARPYSTSLRSVRHGALVRTTLFLSNLLFKISPLCSRRT